MYTRRERNVREKMKPTHPTSDEELDSEEWDRVLSGRLRGRISVMGTYIKELRGNSHDINNQGI